MTEFKQKKILNCDELSKLFSISVASSRIKKLSIPHKNIRNSLHIVLYGEVGSGKSDTINNICKNLKIQPSISLTRATLLGSVDKNSGQFIPPMAWECRNSVLPIDEFSFNHRDPSQKALLSTMLQVMETQEYQKPLGFKTPDFKKRNQDLLLQIKNNKLYVRTRFALMMTTMQNPHRYRGSLTTALISRCIIIPHYPTLEDLKKKAMGLNPFELIRYDPEPEVNISKKDYSYILNYLHSKKLTTTMYLRTLGDLCRIFAVIGEHDRELYDLVYNLKYQINNEM